MESVEKTEKQEEKDKNIIKKARKKTNIFESLENHLLWVKVGDEKKPAIKDDIDKMTEIVTEMLDNHNVKNCMVLVTHHATDIKIF